MAREFAQLRLTVWADRDFTSLTLEQQGIYHMLYSQPTTNLAGVLDYLPGRLSRMAEGLTANRVTKIVKELEERDFVFLDEDTDELLVRSMIRTQAAWKAPNSANSITVSIQQVISRKLKSVLLSELYRIIRESEEAGQWEKARTLLATCAASLENDQINPWAKGSPNPWLKGLPGDGDGDGDYGDGDRDGAKTANSESFNEWWNHWPKKTAKGDAKKAFTKAIKQAGLPALIEGANNYTSWIKRNQIEDRYIVGPGKWLRDERWTDELTDRQPQQPQMDRQAQILLAERQRFNGGDQWTQQQIES